MDSSSLLLLLFLGYFCLSEFTSRAQLYSGNGTNTTNGISTTPTGGSSTPSGYITPSYTPPPDYAPPPDHAPPPDDTMSAGDVAATVPLVVLFLVIVATVVLSRVFLRLCCKGCLRRIKTKQQGTVSENPNGNSRGLSLQGGTFTFEQIKAATDNFDPANMIGRGGFGSVYKGTLVDGTIIAVKRLSSESSQGDREFLTEISMIFALQHPYLVKLYGWCTEGNHLMLVYKYMENNSLARALFDSQLQLDWPTRHKICVGIAKGLAYLHEESRLKIVHRDIKANNVLLDKDLNPKISDFGLAKLVERKNTHISTRNIAGTFGYMAPEYEKKGHITDKADVYSFGVVALEIVSGKKNTTYIVKDDNMYLLDWARILEKKGNLMELVDPRLESNFPEEEVMTVINVALLCTRFARADRPTMSSVVSVLEGRARVQDISPDLSISSLSTEE